VQSVTLKSFIWKRTLRSHTQPPAGTTGWSKL
jgi:hypothetical protein